MTTTDPPIYTRWLAVAAALVVFIVGFGMLSVLSLIVDSPAHLRGLYSYWSSTLGYGLFAPLAVGGFSLTVNNLPRTHRHQSVGVLVASMAILLVVLTQLAWLADPTIGLNWTIPEPHTFNLAGWYNAFVMCCLAGALGYLIGQIIAVASRTGTLHSLARVRVRHVYAGNIIGVMGMVGFAVTVLMDNLPMISSSGAQATVGTVLLALGILIAAGLLLRPTKADRHLSSSHNYSGP